MYIKETLGMMFLVRWREICFQLIRWCR